MKRTRSVLRMGWRRIWKIAMIVGAAWIVLLLALPVWFPWVLRPILKGYDIHFTTYERIGYGRFQVSDVRAQFPRVTLEVGHLEADLPYAWLSRPAADDPPRVLASHWTLRTNTIPPRSRRTNSLFSVLDQVEASFALLRRWVPSAVVTNGEIEIGTKIIVPAVEWREGILKGTVRPTVLEEPLAVAINVSTSENYFGVIRLEPQDAGVEFALMHLTNQWVLSGTATWHTNRADLTAWTDHKGWWPDEMLIQAGSLRLPARVLGGQDYDYFEGLMMLRWETNRFLFEVAGSAQPQASATHLPPLTIDLRARGTTESVTVERLRIAAPWLQTDLSAPVTIDREGRLLGAPASLSLTADLAHIPWLKLAGKVQGTVRIDQTAKEYPKAAFDITGEELTAHGLNIRTARLTGEFFWPTVMVSEARITLADRSALSAEGQFDVERRHILNARWQFHGGFLHRFLPPDIHYTGLTASGECSGAPTNLTHAGQLQATELKVPSLRPLKCDLNWSGQSLNLTQAQALIQASSSRLDLTTKVQVTTGKDATVNTTLQALTFRRENQPLYELEAPVGITVQAQRGRDGGPRLDVKLDGALRWNGADRSVFVSGMTSWPELGQVQVKAHGVAEYDFVEFIESPFRGITISDLGVEANWTNSPVAFDITLSGELNGGQQPLGSATTPSVSRLRAQEGRAGAQTSRRALSVRANITGNANGVTLQPLEIASEIAPMLRLEGTAPFLLVPFHRTNWLQVDEQRPFGLRASLEKTEWASYGFGAKGKAILRHPTLDLAIRGTATEPVGHVQFTAASIEWRSVTNEVELLELEDFALDAAVDRNNLRLQNLAVVVGGQPVNAKAEWPIDRGAWKDLITKRRLPDWRAATAHLQIVEAGIAPLAELAPNILQPEGRLSLDLSVLRGGRLDGHLTISNAATRPFASLTPVHDIGARVEFRNRTAIIERFEGDFGGQPIHLHGQGWLPEEGQPRFAIDLRGSNVTLIRRSGLILRGDVDVRLAREQASQPKLSGKVKLHDGLFLLPVASLMPGSLSVQKPGLASIGVTNEPFADWQIDIEIAGDEFLRVRTPLFSGAMSIDAHVQGRLGAPTAIGDVRVGSGRVQFPFGTLAIEQGYLNLSGDVADSEIFMTASGRNYNYNLRLEVSGGLEEPVVMFSSAPPLSSEQILLMLSAGEMPNDAHEISTGSKVTKLASFVGTDLLNRWRGDDGSEERLTIRSAEDISEAGKTTYSVEYHLTDRWSLIGEYDRFSAFNAGVKWKLISR